MTEGGALRNHRREKEAAKSEKAQREGQWGRAQQWVQLRREKREKGVSPWGGKGVDRKVLHTHTHTPPPIPLEKGTVKACEVWALGAREAHAARGGCRDQAGSHRRRGPSSWWTPAGLVHVFLSLCFSLSNSCGHEQTRPWPQQPWASSTRIWKSGVGGGGQREEETETGQYYSMNSTTQASPPPSLVCTSQSVSGQTRHLKRHLAGSKTFQKEAALWTGLLLP